MNMHYMYMSLSAMSNRSFGENIESPETRNTKSPEN